MKKEINKTSVKKSAKKENLKTYVAIVLDRSGSMSSIKNETIGAFNQQVKTLKESTKKGMETKVSLVTFSTFADKPTLWNEDISKLSELTGESYQPDGYTAMYDGVGETIDRLKELPDANDKNVSFLMIIVSDGQENNSKRYSGQDVANRIASLQGTDRWTFTYLGANQDLSKVAQAMNIPVGNMQVFTADSVGVRTAANITANAVATYMTSRSIGETAMRNFYSSTDDIGKNNG